MGVLTRASRNISRRKVRALLVIIALGFSMTIMISIPAGVMANQRATEALTDNLAKTITQTEALINQTGRQLDCNLDPTMSGYGTPSFVYHGASMFNPFTALGMGGYSEQALADAAFAQLLGGEGNVPMQQNLYSDINSIEGVDAVVPILLKTEGQTIEKEYLNRYFDVFIIDYVIEGVPLNSSIIDNYPILPTNITMGRNLQEGDSWVVVISERLREYFGPILPRYGYHVPVDVGDTITVAGNPLRVIGIFEPSGVDDAFRVYMKLSDAQALTWMQGKVTTLRVFTDTTERVNEVVDAIKEEHEELIMTTAKQRLQELEAAKAQYAVELENAKISLSQTQATAMQEIIVVLAATSLIVMVVMLYTVHERTKEIGTLKAIGFSNFTVMRQFVIEGVLISIIAGLVGTAIGIFAAPTLSSFLLPSLGSSATAVTATVDTQLILLTFGAAVFLGAIGSLYPAWRASRTKPAEAMRYE